MRKLKEAMWRNALNQTFLSGTGNAGWDSNEEKRG
jgi:hypothetical protein